MKTINLFFLRNGIYDCIVTTKDEITSKYARKVTVELEEAKDWKYGSYVSRISSGQITNLKKFDDEDYFYIDTTKWLFGDQKNVLFMAIEKEIVNGNEEYKTNNLTESLNNSSCVYFLST